MRGRIAEKLLSLLPTPGVRRLSTQSRSSLSSPLGTGGRSGLPLADIDRFRSPVARVAIDINAELFVSPEVER
jgi:hypothetical protein